MGLVDAISAEDRVDVKFSDFYRLVKEAAQFEIVMRAIKNDVPHEYMRKMLMDIKETKESED